VIHVDDLPGGDDEEAYVIVPNGSKVAIAVPLDAVGRLASVTARATADADPPCCPDCGERLPVHWRNRDAS
jgi:hypothetical protein